MIIINALNVQAQLSSLMAFVKTHILPAKRDTLGTMMAKHA